MNDLNDVQRLGAADDAAGGTRRPFSKAVRAGDFVYVSGQVPVENGEVIAGGIVPQTKKVIEQIIEILRSANCGLEHVVKVNVWLDDPRDFTSFNGVFESYFKDSPPARSAVQSRLMVDAKVEMDVIAYKKQ